MVDPNNQNYFELGEPTAQVPVPFWRQRRVLVRAGIGLTCIAVLGLVGMYVYQSYQLGQIRPDTQSDLIAAKEMINESDAACTNDPDPTACKAKARSEAAQATGQASVCVGLTGSKLNNCVQLIALNARDPEICLLLEGEQETSCQDSARLVAATTAQDYAMCAVIVDADKLVSCQTQLLSVVIEAGECEKYSIDETVCAAPAKLAAIIDAGDPRACAQLSGNEQAGCLDWFRSIDRDTDGLSRMEESELGTSDDLADTDGDGYDDGQEVSTGHDPLS